MWNLSFRSSNRRKAVQTRLCASIATFMIIAAAVGALLSVKWLIRSFDDQTLNLGISFLPLQADMLTCVALSLLAVVLYGLRASSKHDRTAQLAFVLSVLAACFFPSASALDGCNPVWSQQFQPQMRYFRQARSAQGAEVTTVAAPSNLYSPSLRLRGGGGLPSAEVAEGAVGKEKARMGHSDKFSLDAIASEVSRATSSENWGGQLAQSDQEEQEATGEGGEGDSPGFKSTPSVVTWLPRMAGGGARSEDGADDVGRGEQGAVLRVDINRMESMMPVTEEKFDLGHGRSLRTRVWIVNGDVYCRWKVFGDVEDMHLHWGVAMTDPDQWLFPGYIGMEHIVPKGSWHYKDRAIRTPLVKVPEGRLQATMMVPAADPEKVPTGIRFSLYEPSNGQWYPGGMGGNYFVPIRPEAPAAHKPPRLKKLPSFTGALDLEKMRKDVEEESSQDQAQPEKPATIEAQVIKLGKKEDKPAEASPEKVQDSPEKFQDSPEKVQDSPEKAQEAAPSALAEERGVPRMELEGKEREAAARAKAKEEHRRRQSAAHFEHPQLDIPAVMWNAAERAQRWLDGHREPISMRIQRSPSFERAVVEMERKEEAAKKDMEEAAALWVSQQSRLYVAEVDYHNENGRHKGSLRVTVRAEKHVEITLLGAKRDKIGLGGNDVKLHWGVWTKKEHWAKPPASMTSRLPDTTVGELAVTTAMKQLDDEGNGRHVSLTVDSKDVLGLSFVLRDDSSGQWYKEQGHDFQFAVTEAARELKEKSDPSRPARPDRMVRTPSGTELLAPAGAPAAQSILESESRIHMTLMHRYNKVADLLQNTPPGPAGRDTLLTLFCWLRYSQTRQLTWQRNYNTKPRELSAAAENLNKHIAWRWKNADPVERELLRLMLGTISRGGSGGDGQAIRDEILHIMHRHGLPETKGNFMEEWHQKLHNNSTPDDIFICEAYLAFLHSNGNHGEFWRVLEENGVTRERLRSFERPIYCDPHFFGHLKDGLIHDFNNYLRILKNVHAGADLEKSVEHARWMLDGHLNALLDRVLRERHAHGHYVVVALDCITEARQLLGGRMTHEPEVWKLRDLLYLDLALEAQVRLLSERSVGAFDKVSPEHKAQTLGVWASLALENMIISATPGTGAMLRDEAKDALLGNEMKAACRDWTHLIKEGHTGLPGGWPVRAMALVERMRRLLADMMDWFSDNVQDKAEYLGHGLAHVTPEKMPETWAITLFTEELIRGGGCSFVMSSILRRLDSAIRAMGGGTFWQVISQGSPGAIGKLESVGDLLSVQSKVYTERTVLLAKSVSGEEEVPAGVEGVITCDAPDLLAHISVRARNLKVLLATCFDEEEFQSLDALVGKHVSCTLVDGEVVVEECDPSIASPLDQQSQSDASNSGLLSKWLGMGPKPQKATFTTWCYPEKKIDPDAHAKDFGAKSSNIVRMRRTLPDWIRTPASAVIPFGVFDKVMRSRDNSKISAEFNRLLNKVLPGSGSPEEVLAELKALTMQLTAPHDMHKAVRQAMEQSGLVIPGELEGEAWEQAFTALKQVWASRWNTRAFYSCKRSQFDLETVQMAVLVQRLVEAEYAFVIHTVNPSSNDPAEMYAEVVVGLGETLVGNYPGRALGFVCNKDGSSPPRVMSLPSKSKSLHGAGLIFRSDSNAEDLPGFAGAGLYDSVPMVTNEARTVCYCKERLVMEQAVAEEVMRGICKVAVDVENAMGGVPQDIEGCYKGGHFYVVQTRPQV